MLVGVTRNVDRIRRRQEATKRARTVQILRTLREHLNHGERKRKGLHQQESTSSYEVKRKGCRAMSRSRHTQAIEKCTLRYLKHRGKITTANRSTHAVV